MSMMPDYDWFSDTHPRSLKVFLDRQQRMTPGEKMAAVLQTSEMLLRLAEAGVRSQYPNADEREVFLRTASRHLDRQTMIQVYGWDPEAHP